MPVAECATHYATSDETPIEMQERNTNDRRLVMAKKSVWWLLQGRTPLLKGHRKRVNNYTMTIAIVELCGKSMHECECGNAAYVVV